MFDGSCDEPTRGLTLAIAKGKEAGHLRATVMHQEDVARIRILNFALRQSY